MTLHGITRDIRVEYIPLTSIIDDSVTITANSKWIAPTSQEFYFKYFLRNRYPDLLLVFLPFLQGIGLALASVCSNTIGFVVLFLLLKRTLGKDIVSE